MSAQNIFSMILTQWTHFVSRWWFSLKYVIVAAFQTLVPSCLHAHREPVARVLVAEARGQGIEGLGGQVATSFSTRSDRHC